MEIIRFAHLTNNVLDYQDPLEVPAHNRSVTEHEGRFWVLGIARARLLKRLVLMLRVEEGPVKDRGQAVETVVIVPGIRKNGSSFELMLFFWPKDRLQIRSIGGAQLVARQKIWSYNRVISSSSTFLSIPLKFIRNQNSPYTTALQPGMSKKDSMLTM